MGYPLARLNLVSALAQLYGNFTFELAPEVRAVLAQGALGRDMPTVYLRIPYLRFRQNQDNLTLLNDRSGW